MQKAYIGPGQIKSFRNNYLALAIATALLLITSVCSAQSVASYDSTKNRQVQSSYGFDYGNITVGTLRIPRDTVKMAVKDSGAIAYKRGAVYVWSGRVWLLVSGTSVILNPAPGIDSIRFTQYTVCVYPHDEESQCYEWLSFPTNAHISDDSARYVFTNSRNDSIFSLPTKLVHAVGVNGITITRGGTGPDGLDTIYYSGSGGSGSGTDSTAFNSVTSFTDTSFTLHNLRGDSTTIVIHGGGGTSSTPIYQLLTASAAQTSFSFTTVPTLSAGFQISINGAIIPKTYYSVSTNDIIFSAGLVAGDKVILQGTQ